VGFKVEGLAPLLQVYDMPRSVAFYRDKIGFEVVAKAPDRPGDEFDWALLRRDGVELMLNTQHERDHRPARPGPGRAAAHGDTVLFFGCRDLDAAYADFRAKGLNVSEPVVREYGMRQLSLHDPDGYGLCFQWRAEG